MKRLLCLLLAGLMLFAAAACSAGSLPRQAEPETQPTEPLEGSSSGEPSEAPSDFIDDLTPMENPPIRPGESLDHPPIDLDDPIEPISEPMGGSAETTEATDLTGDAAFSDLLSAALLSGTQNRNLSPISVYLALAMVAEGADGDTLAELLNLLGCKDLAELRGVCGALLESLSVDTDRSTLDLHNSLWMADTVFGEKVTFRDAYLSVLTDTYRSEANTVDFGSTSSKQQIADWINKYTRGKINVKPDALNFNPDTLAVLINTIYLKDGWAETFSEERTESGTFYSPDGEIDVDYMNRDDANVTVRRGDGWYSYRVYLNRIGYVTFVLPDEDVPLPLLLGTPDAIGTLLRGGTEKQYDVSLKIPKFKFRDKMELTAVLSSLGLNLSFTPDADFSGMSDMPCRIDEVIQESYIGVDENGVEAAAYTMISMRTTGFMEPVQLEKLDFHLTRPFLYAIESRDGTVLFIGTVTVPGTNE